MVPKGRLLSSTNRVLFHFHVSESTLPGPGLAARFGRALALFGLSGPASQAVWLVHLAMCGASAFPVRQKGRAQRWRGARRLRWFRAAKENVPNGLVRSTASSRVKPLHSAATP